MTRPTLPSSSGARQTMRANRRVDTGPERALRAELHRLGLRFRKDLRLKLNDSFVRPDVVFPRAKVAVFVDGCFWHCCPDHGEMPKSNRSFWEQKLKRNVERDRENDQALTENGWAVLRFFEHTAPVDAAQIVLQAVKKTS